MGEKDDNELQREASSSTETDPALPKDSKLKCDDQITNVIGDVGRWQLEKILLVFLASAPGKSRFRKSGISNKLFSISGLAHIFHAGFITPKQRFWCNKALDEAGNNIPPPWTVECKYNDTITTMVDVWPSNMTTDKKLLGHCIPECVDYEFDPDFWVSTLVTEWDLVCEKSWLKTLAKMLLFTGLALGSFCSGLVSDRFGRKIAIWSSSVTMCIFGIITSFVPWYPVFVFCWWITGTMAIACYTAAFVWAMEVAAGKYKVFISMSMNYSWPTCRLIIAGLVYWLRDYHWHLRSISAMVAVGSVLLYWLPESPRWLIAKSRIEEAKKVLSDASKTNGKPVEPEDIVLITPITSASQGGFLDILKHPTLRIQLLIMYFNWFTTAFIMYGLALSWQNLTGGLFLNFIIGTILDFPAKTLALILVQKVGRKYPYMISTLTTGVMFLLTLFIERDKYPSNWPIVVLALIGNFCTTFCFAVLYMYTG